MYKTTCLKKNERYKKMEGINREMVKYDTANDRYEVYSYKIRNWKLFSLDKNKKYALEFLKNIAYLAAWKLYEVHGRNLEKILQDLSKIQDVAVFLYPYWIQNFKNDEQSLTDFPSWIAEYYLYRRLHTD